MVPKAMPQRGGADLSIMQQAVKAPLLGKGKQQQVQLQQKAASMVPKAQPMAKKAKAPVSQFVGKQNDALSLELFQMSSHKQSSKFRKGGKF